MKKSAKTPDGRYEVIVNDDNSITVLDGGSKVSSVAPVLREICQAVSMEYDSAWNTRRFGSNLVDYLASLKGAKAEKSSDDKPAAKKKASKEKVHIEIRSTQARGYTLVDRRTWSDLGIASPYIPVEEVDGKYLYVNGELVETFFEDLIPSVEDKCSGRKQCTFDDAEEDGEYDVFEIYYAGAIAKFDLDVTVDEFDINKLDVILQRFVGICGPNDGKKHPTFDYGVILGYLTYDDQRMPVICESGEAIMGTRLIDTTADRSNRNFNVISATGVIPEIPQGTFQNCINAVGVTMPDTITSIEDLAFAGCVKVENVKLSNQLESIGYQAFIACRSLEKIVLPGSLQHVDECAFAACDSLKTVVIEDGVRELGAYMFFKAPITEISIPDSVTEIRMRAFLGCVNLKKVRLPEGLTQIAPEVFKNCLRLESIVIPASVKSIGESAFANCTSLKKVIIKGHPEIADDAFDGSPAQIKY